MAVIGDAVSDSGVGGSVLRETGVFSFWALKFHSKYISSINCTFIQYRDKTIQNQMRLLLNDDIKLRLMSSDLSWRSLPYR